MGVIVRGYVEDVGSKCGVRFVHFGAIEPYNHTVMIEVEGDEGREDDNSLTEDLWPFCRGKVEVNARLESGDLYARPSDFRALAGIETGTAETVKQGSVPKG